MSAKDLKDARLVRDEMDAALLLRAVVRQVGLAAALKLLTEVAAECEEAGTTEKGGEE